MGYDSREGIERKTVSVPNVQSSLNFLPVSDPVLKGNPIDAVLDNNSLGFLRHLFFELTSCVKETAFSRDMRLLITDLGEHHLTENLTGAMRSVPSILQRCKVGEHYELNRTDNHVEARDTHSRGGLPDAAGNLFCCHPFVARMAGIR